eukprot:3817489-Lingulodinium_polyedra.AAC.1
MDPAAVCHQGVQLPPLPAHSEQAQQHPRAPAPQVHQGAPGGALGDDGRGPALSRGGMRLGDWPERRGQLWLRTGAPLG